VGPLTKQLSLAPLGVYHDRLELVRALWGSWATLIWAKSPSQRPPLA